MRLMHLTNIFYFLFFCFLQHSLIAAAPDPTAIYLTWQRQPETTMTIHWVTNEDQKSELVHYHKKGELDWHSSTGASQKMPENYPFLIHVTELVNLNPDTEYFFKFSTAGVEYKFRTMSTDYTKPFCFIVGGDIYHDGLDVLEKMNKQAAKLNPMFAIVGGDLAYNDDKLSSMPKVMPRWMDWLIAWKNQMIAPDGRLIPMIPAIGNHDVKGSGYNKTPAQAPFFYALFAFPGPQGFNVLDFGNFMSIFILDSGHTNPVAGKQTQWLSQALEQRVGVSHKFAAYHVGAFPSYRPFTGLISSEIRKNWVPLFEKFGLQTAFEHHDHTYKRTWPIRNEKIDLKEGIIYLGDGAWAVEKPRDPKNLKTAWYLAQAKSSRNVIFVTVSGHERHFLAIDDTGKIIDEVISK
jgi:acid phosphatase type 7